MPFIKRLKPGKLPAFQGEKAYEWIEVDEMGNPIPKRSDAIEREMRHTNKFISRTEKKIAPGVRAPDVLKGYKKPFDYHLWNRLRAQGKVRRKKK